VQMKAFENSELLVMSENLTFRRFKYHGNSSKLKLIDELSLIEEASKVWSKANESLVLTSQAVYIGN